MTFGFAMPNPVQQDVQATASRLEALIEHLQAGVLVEDESRHIVHLNAELCAKFGISVPPQALIGMDCSQSALQVKHLFAEPEEFVRRVEELLCERQVVTGEELCLADGRVFERDYVPIFAGEEYRGNLWQYRDVTERRRVEEALWESEQRFRVLFEQSPEAVLLIEPEEPWRVVDCSPAACEMNGYSYDELIGMPLTELDPRWKEPEVRRQHIELLRQGHRFEGETIHRRKNGTIFPIEYSTSLISIEGRQLILGTDRDITERKRAEECAVAFSELTHHLNSATTGVSAARIIADTADNLLGWDACALLLRSPEDDLLHPILSFDIVHGRRTEFPPGEPPIPPGSLSRRAMEEGPQLLLKEQPSIGTRGLRPFGDTDRPSASLMFVPIRGAVVIGVLTIQSYTPNAYSEANLGTLQALADSCGGALERLRAEEGLREAHQKLTFHVENSPLGVIEWDHEFRVARWSPQAERIFGWEAGEVLGKRPSEWRFVFEEDEGPVGGVVSRLGSGGEERNVSRNRNYTKDGSVISCEWHNSVLRGESGAMASVLSLVLDVTEREAYEEQLRHQAFHDPLTGLPNRALFMDRLQHALVRATREDQSVAVLYLDMDRFKFVNDSLGHDSGDQLLVATARRVQACLRSEDTVARLGGDELAVLLEGVAAPDEAETIAERIEETLRPAFEVAGHEVVLSTSIGIAVSTAGQTEPEELLRAADIAMYKAKQGGKARYEVFHSGMDSRALDLLELEADLRRAIGRGELRLHYQPTVDLGTGTIVGVEALVRWEHPGRGLVPPLDFIGLAEETGLILPIERWVLRESCRQAREWQEQYPLDPLVEMCVNVSARHFQHPDLVAEVAAALEETGLDPKSLMLEITESAVMEDAESNTVTLHELKDLGVNLAIDDFGTGYSSLSYLRRFPVDALKIDRSFVDGLGRESDDTAIVGAVIGLACSLRLEVIAEGIETAEQVERLRALGCELGQGYYFSKPLPGEAAGALLSNGGRLVMGPGA